MPASERSTAFGRRIGAFLIDLVLMQFVTAAAIGALSWRSGLEFSGDLAMIEKIVLGAGMAAGVIVIFAYGALMESSSWQGTLGKLVMGLRVESVTGARLSLARALGRNAVKMLSLAVFPPIALMPLMNARGAGLHDLGPASRVVVPVPE